MGNKVIEPYLPDPSIEGAAREVRLSATLQRIVDAAAVRGVSIQLELDEECIHVSDLYRDRGHINSEPGGGLKTLRQVCEVADQFEKAVDIEYMADEPKLGELYSSCGFREYCRDAIVAMRRMPREGAKL